MRTLRLALYRLYVVSFTSLVGLIAINGAFTFLLHPERSMVTGLPQPLPWIWAIQYGVGGLMLLTGVAFARHDIEASGCMAFMGGALVNALAWLGALGSQSWNTVALLVCFAVAAGARLVQLLQHRVIVLLPAPPEARVE